MAYFVYCSRCMHTLTAHGGQAVKCKHPKCDCPYWRAYELPVNPQIHHPGYSTATRIHRTVRVFLRRGLIPREPTPGYRGGAGSYLAKHFGVSRQRISQVVRDERAALDNGVTKA